jgi:hypothetical protein
MLKQLVYKLAETITAAMLAATYVHSTMAPPVQFAALNIDENDNAAVDEARIFQRVCHHKPLIRPVANRPAVQANDDLIVQINEQNNRIQNQIDALVLRINNINKQPGPAGPAGAPGLAGKDGMSGLPGKDGAAGIAGPPGKDGKSPSTDEIVKIVMDQIGTPQRGPAGPVGPAGHDGIAGAPGKNGTDGKSPAIDEIVAAVLPQLPKGPAGKDGLVGATGPAGPAGSRGPAGAPGKDAVINQTVVDPIVEQKIKQLPFWFKVIDPTGHFRTSPPVEVYLGDQLNLVLQPVASGGMPSGATPSVTKPEPTTSGGTL